MITDQSAVYNDYIALLEGYITRPHELTFADSTLIQPIEQLLAINKLSDTTVALIPNLVCDSAQDEIVDNVGDCTEGKLIVPVETPTENLGNPSCIVIGELE